MSLPATATTAAQLPHVSPVMLGVFAAYVRRSVRRNFHALRISADRPSPTGITRPLVICLNHASWWDPLVCLLLAREFFPDRTSFAPIDAAMLARYRFFKHLGFFGIEQRSRRGTLAFLRTSHAILSSPANALWITPQGRFADVRERPPRLEAGLGALAAHMPDAAFVPLAIEYPFWAESRPEILVSFGRPIIPSNGPAHSVSGWTGVFADALAATQDQLAARACRRDAADWLTLSQGSSGVNVLYDGWRWLRARIRGEKFVRGHHTEVAP